MDTDEAVCVEEPQLDYWVTEQLSHSSTVLELTQRLKPLLSFAGNEFISRILNKRSSSRLMWLHTAIFERNFDAVKLFHTFGADLNAKCYGTPAIHLVATIRQLPGGTELGLDAFQYLVEHSDLVLRDDQGSSIMHVLAENDMFDEFDIVLKLGPSKLVSGLLEAKDRLGYRPLHRAALGGSRRILQKLIELNVDLQAQTNCGFSALHCVLEGGMSEDAVVCWKMLVDAKVSIDNLSDGWGRSAASYALEHGFVLAGDLLICSESVKTAVLTHPVCIRHATCPPSQAGSSEGPPENAKRLTVLVDEEHGALRAAELFPRLDWVDNCREAAISDVLRVHEWSYVRQLQDTCSKLRDDPETEGGLTQLDGDTTVGRDTYSAAMHAAGALTEGVDMVMSGAVRNAFCAVRPPGHHVGPRGVVKSDGPSDSYGFCLLNNISIGAAYALNKYRDIIKRVAIVDFDVHHGNGTEETVRWLKPGVQAEEVVTPFFFGSVHQPLYKPWYGVQDPNNVLFVSVHGYGTRQRGLEYLFPRAAFYPGTGKTAIPDMSRFGNAIEDKSVDATIIIEELDEHGHAVTAAKYKHRTPSVVDIPVESDNKSSENMDNDDSTGSKGSREEGGEDSGDDDDDDDEDYVAGGDDGDDDNDDEAMEMLSAGDDDDDEDEPKSRVERLQKMYSSHAAFDKNIKKANPDPLILDIGMPLPSLDQDEVDVGAAYRYEWRSYFRDEIFPRLLKFSPDMIFISAGFDGHKKDVMNSGYLALLEEDFEWLTTSLIRIANRCCNGRVVSALEGGYQIGGEHCSSFAKSVKAHVNALARGGNSRAPYQESHADAEKNMEAEWLQQAAAKIAAKKAQEQAILQAKAAVQATNKVTSHSVPVTVEDGNRKRRRAAVDYAALDADIRRAEGTSSNE